MSRIVHLTTADTEILALAGAVERLPDDFPDVQAHNPSRVPPDPEARADWLEEVLAGAGAVAVRLLGGRAAFPDLFEALQTRCAGAGIPFLAFSGESTPDAELTRASTAPTAALAQAFEYLRLGGTDNAEHYLRFLADTLLMTGFGFDEPRPLPDHGAWHPRRDEPLAPPAHDRPVVGVVFYRAHLASGNTDFVAALIDALEERGTHAVGLHCATLRPDDEGRVPVLDEVADAGLSLDALVVTVLAMGGSHAADVDAWRVPALEDLDVPVVQAICATSSRERWVRSEAGLSPLDAAMQVAMPEFDGRIVTVPFSFKQEQAGDSPVGGPLVRYVPDPERTARVAGIAAAHARLRRLGHDRVRLGVVLSNYPTTHARIGNGVGLDTPASTCTLLRALAEAGYDLGDDLEEAWLTDGDALIHALIQRGGFDREFLTGAELARAPVRLDADTYRAWFTGLPEPLAGRIVEQWGPPPGEVLTTPDGGALVVPVLTLGNVALMIQPPRGFGEDPVAIYHDPDLPPTHQYLAAYWWLTRRFGADALVHMGKHGTLEWLPGKGLGMSAACAPDAALGDTPLIYPFVVNDPGEGTQAKRRAHATVVDHLVPPMQRAEVYDDLARLEQLLDEYAELEALDPGKLPAIRDQVWKLMVETDVTTELGVEDMPDDTDEFGELITDVDGWLCEIKDLQIRDGLHVLGAPPGGEQLCGLVRAVLRLPQAGRPALRATVAAAFGLDEQVLTREGGRRLDGRAARGEDEPDLEGLTALAPGPVRTRGDALDRVDEVAGSLVAGMAETGWESGRAPEVAAGILGRPRREVAGVLALAAAEVVPRIRACTVEIDRVLAALDGRFVPAGPAGSPTRGRLDVLPTGRNFHSVDPRGIPSPIAWDVGRRLADDLVRRHVEEEGAPPASVGIVVWGTANMRTRGDDVAEILALLGVRPTWHEETRRVTGLEVIPLAELDRPRVDVTIRISGFFRDAFPHLVDLLDDAVALVAGRDEPDHLNPVAAHARTDRERLVAEGVDEPEADRRARTRIFGSKPGTYGAGLLPLIQARNWRDTDDLAEVYSVWSGHAYGRDLDGRPARAEMEAAYGRVEVALKNVDTREHDLLDSDDYFQEHGGMVATVRAVTGRAPHAWVGDSSDPAAPRTRSLREEVGRVFRGRVVNPRWIGSMQRHGYKGAFELAATVDYLFGYDATTGVVDDWQYDAVGRAYVLDEDVRGFMERSNPWALRAVAERLLEAEQRGLWDQPDPEVLDGVRAAYLELEGDLEEERT